MKKRLTSLFLAFLMMVSLLPAYALAADGIPSGSGTAEEPYVIEDAADLLAVKNNLSGYYILAADISPETWTADLGSFRGTLDGNGYTITLPKGAVGGLFKSGTSGTIKDLTLRAEDVTSASTNGYAGILADGYFGGKLYNCSVIGNLTLSTTKTTVYVGGFCGCMNMSTAELNNCFAAVTLTYQYSGTVEDGEEAPEATKYIGALVGAPGTQWQKGKLANCYYDSTLFETAIGNDNAEQTANCTGKTTEEFKTLAATLNENVPKGQLTWKDTESYPVFSSHAEILILSGEATLTGEAKVGETLTVTDTFPAENPNAKTYAWYRVDGTGTKTLMEHTGASYTLTAEDIGCKFQVVAAMENTFGKSETAASAVVTSDDTVTVSFTGAPEGADVTLSVKHNGSGAVLGRGKSVSIPSVGTYTWFASADGYNTATGTFTANGEDITVTVEMTALSQVEWSSEKVNGMQIGDLDELPRFPTSSENAALKWATCAGLYGSSGVGANGEVTNPVFMDDYLYIIGGEGGKQQILKIDPENGDILKRVFVHGQGGYYYFLACGGGLIYFRGNGYVQAFDKELNEAWLYEDATIPASYAGSIVYDGGFLYFGTAVSRNSGVANFYCLSASDGSLVWKMCPELDYDSGDTADWWGFYWANPLVIGDYVLCGSDGGRLYCWDRYTGEVVDYLDPGEDMGYTGKDIHKKPFIRSGVVTDGEGRIYFTSSDGYVHMASFDSATGKISGHKYALINASAGSGGNSTFGGNSSSSTPVVYNGRLYAGSDLRITVYDAETLEMLYYNDIGQTSGYSFDYHSGGTTLNMKAFGKIRDLRLVAGDNGDVYVFSSHYAPAGSIVMFKDAPGQTKSTGFISFAEQTANYAQYNATSPIIGPDGTIYCTNDLGYLMAIEKMDACLTAMTASTGTLDKAFSSTTRSYELVVPRGTQSVTLTLAATEGASVKVNDATVTDTADIALTDGTASAAIVVTLGSYSITYTLSIREASNNVGASAAISAGNSFFYTSSEGKLAEGVDNAFVLTGCDSDSRLWLTPLDANAEMEKPTIVSGTSANATDVSDNDYAYNGITYIWRFYFGSPTYPTLAKTNVTAEDGVTKKTYYAAMFEGDADAILAHDANEDGSFDPETEYLMAASISKTGHDFSAAEEEITLTASAEYAGKAPEDTTLTWASSDNTVAEVDEGGKVKMLKHGTAVISAKNADGLGAECVVTLNTAPALKEGVESTAAAEVTAGEAYTLDLTGIFADADGDTLTYTVQVGDADAVAADASYSYTSASAGTVTLVFTASDGISTSEPYTVTLTVKASGGSSGGGTTPAEPKSITVYVSLSDENGKFVTGKDGTLLWNVELDVYDEDGDGKYTLDEAMLALHDEYHADGTSAYSGGNYVSKLWGEPGGNYGFVLNNKWCSGAPTKIKKNDKINVFFYQDWDSGEYSDLYAYFSSISYTAKTGTEKTFTVNGLNIMMSGETSNAYGTPEGASVTVYDKNGDIVLTAVTDENGKFALTFSDPGTYTVEVGGTCDYTATGEWGSGTYTDAPIAPARCTVTVTGASTGGSTGGVVTPGQTQTTETTLPFADVKKEDWFYEAAKWAYDLGLTTGTSAATFSPDVSCSRAEMVTFLWRAAGSPAPKSTTHTFKDVNEKSWYYQALLWAVENGITTGTSASTFSPDMACTRGQMALFLYRMAGTPAVSGGESTFNDVSADAYYAAAVRWAVEKSITNGTGNGAFSPDMVCTRGQMVTFLYRYLAN